MGIKGTVRRNQDGDFIHANVDTDVFIAPEPELGSTDKPEEIFRIIEQYVSREREGGGVGDPRSELESKHHENTNSTHMGHIEL